MNVGLVLLIRVLEAMFLLGLGGSAIVLILTTFEDVEILFSRETPTSAGHIGGSEPRV